MSRLIKRTSSAKRPAHHANNSATSFQNPWPSANPPTWGELVRLSFPLAWYSPEPAPDHIRPVQVVEPDWGAPDLQLKREGNPNSDHIVGTWLGHAGALAQFPPLSASPEGSREDESTYCIFDPIFSFRAGPTPYTGPSRFRKSPCQAADLPGCQAGFISHNHYDHLDLATVLDLSKCHPEMKWFAGLGNKAWFLASGVKAENVIELDWWQTWEGSFATPRAEAKGERPSWFRVTCVPAQHKSGRSGFDGGSTLWCGWVVERFSGGEALKSESERRGAVYHAGDTGYRRIEGSTDTCPAFKEIGNRFNGFDLSFIPIWRGGSLGFVSYTGIRLLHQHMPAAFHCSPADAVNIHRDVKSKNTVAIHFGTFVGSEKESQEAVMEFYEACMKGDIRSLVGREIDENGRAGTLHNGESHIFEIQ